MKLKKILTTAVSGILSVCLLAGCGGTGSNTAVNSGNGSDNDGGGDDYVVKIAYNNSLCEAPIQMGVEKGFFEAEGIKFEMVQVDAAHMPEAIGSGQVDAGFGLLGKYLQPIDNGLDIKITAGIHTGCIKVLVPKDSPIKTVADLKGKRVGTTGLGAAAPTIITRRSLYHAGLNASNDNCDVEFVVFSGSDLAQALENGAVDAIANADPQASVAEEEYNLRTLIDTATDDEYKDEYCCISFVTGKLAEEHPDLAKKFTAAVMKSSQYVDRNQDDVAKIQVEKNWISGNPEFNASVLKKYNYKPSLNGGYEALKATVPDLQAIGLINADREPDEFIDSIVLKFDALTDAEILGESTSTNDSLADNRTMSYDDNTMPSDCCG